MAAWCPGSGQPPQAVWLDYGLGHLGFCAECGDGPWQITHGRISHHINHAERRQLTKETP